MAATTNVFESLSVDDLVREFAEIEVPPKFKPEESRLLGLIWRRLAQGTPATYDEIDSFASKAGVAPEQALELLRWMAEPDVEGRVQGLLGLTLNQDFPTKLLANGVELRTWCAWDSLFLPLMLGGDAVVEASSAVDGTPVRVVIGPEGVRSVEPESANVSFTIPTGEQRGVETVEDVWMVFCHHLLYFASRQEAETWAAGREGMRLAALPVREAFALSERAFGDIAREARSA